jgi:hypothetical protein
MIRNPWVDDLQKITHKPQQMLHKAGKTSCKTTFTSHNVADIKNA